ncbi:hypothetical protein ACH5RR_034310 [Cinchona calisaya]|uniref:Uncharacterized protein n=1 Tax=Cinchona calisaya TaxID=153742 RepID=A0ABD2YE54_9GENT
MKNPHATRPEEHPAAIFSPLSSTPQSSHDISSMSASLDLHSAANVDLNAGVKVLNTATKNTTIITNAPIYSLLNKGVVLCTSKTTSNLTTHNNIIASPLDSRVDGGTVEPPKYILAFPSKVKVIGKVGK